MNNLEGNPGVKRFETTLDVNSLIKAFQNFNQAATSLASSYQKLEQRVEQLTAELEEKDHQLYSRLRELDRASRYITTLLDTISSGVIAIDLDGRITMFNRMAGELLGRAPENAVDRNYDEVMGKDYLQSGALYTLHYGPELRAVEKVLPATGIRVESSTTWVVDSMGNRVGLIEMFDDVTSLRRLEERVEHHQTLAALGEMAAAVAHELRNPLAGIGGFAALLREDLPAQSDQIELVERIIEGVHSLDRLAGNLLFLTRETKVARASFDPRELVREVVLLLRSEVKQKKLPVRIDMVMPEESIMMAADKELLRMMLTNLGRNALQAMERKGVVTFRVIWRLLANRVDLIVEDEGKGIPPENLDKLFNPFFTTRSEGTGLGLAMVKKAVDLHKGQLRVESEVDIGSRFTATLPIRHVLPPAQPLLEEQPPDSSAYQS